MKRFLTDTNLIKEWNYEKNLIDPSNITIGSAKKVWWICQKGHEWQACVYSRTGKDKNSCPYCSNRKVSYDNSLFATHPELMKEWNFEKNTTDPKQIVSGNNKKVWWKCSNNHEWFISPFNRVFKKTNCPYCSNKKTCPDNCLSTTHLELMKEWDFEKNIIDPKSITYGSSKKVWWKCEKGHEWQSFVYTRTKGFNCPYCFGKLRMKDNNLANIYPELLKEWDFKKNTIDPKSIGCFLKRKVWWICVKGHSWQALVSNRTLHSRRCPYCSKSISKSCKAWLNYLNIGQDNREKVIKCNNKKYIVDALSNNIVYEFLGDFWHGNPNIYNKNDLNPKTKTSFGDLYKKTLNRFKEIKEAGYTIIYIWENDWKKIKE